MDENGKLEGQDRRISALQDALSRSKDFQSKVNWGIIIALVVLVLVLWQAFFVTGKKRRELQESVKYQGSLVTGVRDEARKNQEQMTTYLEKQQDMVKMLTDHTIRTKEQVADVDKEVVKLKARTKGVDDSVERLDSASQTMSDLMKGFEAMMGSLNGEPDVAEKTPEPKGVEKPEIPEEAPEAPAEEPKKESKDRLRFIKPWKWF